MAVVIGIDAGTTGVRALAVDETGSPLLSSYRELTQHYPRPGWVEHDPVEIWQAVQHVLARVSAELADRNETVAAIGMTNQRETAVAWDRTSGQPRHRAVVWQDRRTAGRCDELRDAGYLPLVRERTGLVLDPYFSATKFEWLLAEGRVERGPALALGTVDSWVLWNLTGGPRGGVHATDPSNASRTLLYDIIQRRWSDELCQLFDVPTSSLAEVRPSAGRFGRVASGAVDGLQPGVPVSGIAGDQAAALFGQACVRTGMAKNTYGTGSFVLMNVGATPPPPAEGLLTSVAWELGAGRGGNGGRSSTDVAYALEGAIFSTGSAIQWLRDGLGLISEAAEVGPLAATIDSTEGVYVVPAFTGLGSPWWDPYARGTVVGLTRGTGRAHVARAVVEAMAFQTRDVVEAMTASSGHAVPDLRVDGGASVMDLLLQIQADQLQVPVIRPRVVETTAVGAGLLAGLAEGVWGSVDEAAGLWQPEAELTPRASQAGADAQHAGWRRALERARAWAPS
ncbi:MAG TPA: glycerol kinase GlpK [Acidimicrobiales bacterium]|nr:glycerol kinase GlpK [Acidimicrobiales bacterium]